MVTQPHILLIGDSCKDVYIIGDVNRISPEAPVPVLSNTTTIEKPGMAANVKNNLEALDCIVDFITNSADSIVKTRYVDRKTKNQLLRVDNDTDVEEWQFDYTLDFNCYDAVVISDYNKGFLSYSNIDDVLSAFDGPVFIDTKKTDLKQFGNAYVKINEFEYNTRTSDCEHLIVTLGKNGARYQDREHPVPDIEVTDVCGAGDTFLAALAYQQTNNGNIDQSIEFANRAAAVTVGHFGVYAPSLKEIVPS